LRALGEVLQRLIRLIAACAQAAMLAWPVVLLLCSLLTGPGAEERTRAVPTPSMSVPAAPNQTEIRAIVRNVQQSPDFADRWHLEIEILEATPIHGPQFARVGETAKAFTFGSVSPVQTGDEIIALAEYIGDARGGQFQLSQIRIVN